MNVKEIVETYLKKNGFGGLYNDYLDCGCQLSVLMACECNTEECEPGDKHKCPQCDIDYFVSKESVSEKTICPDCGMHQEVLKL